MYIKPTAHFCLSKTSKRVMSTIVDAEQRNIYKNAMIQAELNSKVKVSSDKKDRSTNEQQT